MLIGRRVPIIGALWLLLLVSTGLRVSEAQTSSDPNDPSEIFTMVASYLGLAEFCATYGVDFRALANEKTEEIGKTVLRYDDPGLSSAFNRGLSVGRQGALWSVQQNRFFYLLEGPRARVPGACQIAHQQLLRLPKLPDLE